MVRKLASCLLFGGLLGLFALHVYLFRGFIVDDAFITFRYVRQVVEGNGFVYNLGERVEGYSNFLWLVLLVPFARLGLDLTLSAKGLGVFFSLLSLFLTWRIARQVEGPALAPLFLALSAPFAAWAVVGLETPLFTFLLLYSGYLFLQEEIKGRGCLSGLFFGLLSLTRPEGLLFPVLALIFRIRHLHRTKTGPDRRDLVRILIFGAIVIPYQFWRLTYYGQLLPNTIYAKSLGLHPRAFLEGVFYLYQSVTSVGGFFFLGLPVFLALFVSPSLSTIYWSISLGTYAAFIVLGGGDWMPMQRFAVHVLPPLVLLIQAGLSRLDALWHFRGRRVLLVLLIAGQCGYLLGSSLEQRFVKGIGAGPLVPQDSPVVTYLRQHVQSGDTIALTDAGFIAYRLPLDIRIVDMVGLTDAHIAQRPVQLPGGLWGRGDAFGKWDVDYVLAQQPRFIQVNIIGETPEGKWLTNFTGTTLLVNDPRFRQMYRPVAGISGLFVRTR